MLYSEAAPPCSVGSWERTGTPQTLLVNTWEYIEGAGGSGENERMVGGGGPSGTSIKGAGEKNHDVKLEGQEPSPNVRRPAADDVEARESSRKLPSLPPAARRPLSERIERAEARKRERRRERERDQNKARWNS